MVVDNIFSPESIEGPEETQAYVDQVLAHTDAYQLGPEDLFLAHYREVLREACAATLSGARGVGAVIAHPGEDGFPEIIARGKNDLADKDFDFAHVAHAEILAIADMNRKNRLIRGSGEGEEYSPENAILFSSLGPCPMCMIACINARIKTVITMAPDWTGGVTMDHIAETYPGFRKYIEQFGLESSDAPVEYLPDEGMAKIAAEIRMLCWAVSRIKEFNFDRGEFEENLDFLDPSALEQLTPRDLQEELATEFRKYDKLTTDHPVVRAALDISMNGCLGIGRDNPIIEASGDKTDRVKWLTHRFEQEYKIRIAQQLISQFAGEAAKLH